MAERVISKIYSKGTQSHNYQEIVAIDNLKLRITIKRDAHDFQSHCFIETMRKMDGAWNVVHSIPYSEIKMKISYVSPATAEDFKADRDELVRVAKALLMEA